MNSKMDISLNLESLCEELTYSNKNIISFVSTEKVGRVSDAF